MILSPMIAPGLCLADEKKEAEKLFQDLYGRQVIRVRATANFDDDRELAKQWIAAVKESAEQKTLVRILCDNIYKLCSRQVEGQDLAIQSMFLMEKHFPKEKRKSRERTLAMCEIRFKAFGSIRGVKESLRHQAGDFLIDACESMAQLCAEDSDFDHAFRYYMQAVDTAKKIKSDRMPLLMARMREMRYRVMVLRRVEQDMNVLAKSPEDERAHKRLYETFLMELDDPDTAMRHIDYALDAEDPNRRMVAMALHPIKSLSADDCLELGDWYATLAESAPDAARPTMFARSELYLNKHLESGSRRASVLLKLKRVRESLAKVGRPEKLRPRHPVTGRSSMRGPEYWRNVTKGLIGHWTFDESKDAQVGDVSGNHYHGQMKDGLSPKNRIKGVDGKALNVKGRGHVACGNIGDFEHSDSFTIACWIKVDSTSGSIIAKGMRVDEKQRGWELFVDGRDLQASFVHEYPNNALLIRTQLGGKADAWRHVLMTYDGTGKAGGVRFYIDGYLNPSSSVESLNGSIRNKRDLTIGNRAGFWKRIHGSIDDVRIYKRVLEPNEIRALAKPPE